MLNEFYAQEAESNRKKQVEDLLSQGLITQDQASSTLRNVAKSPDPTIGQVISSMPETNRGLGLDAQMQSESMQQPSYAERIQAVEDDIEQTYRNTYGQQAPGLKQTLSAYAQMPELGGAKRTNAQKFASKITAEHELAFQSLGSAEARDRVVQRVMNGINVDTAFGRNHANMVASWPQEIADSGNRLSHFMKEGFGLPGMKEHWNRDYEKWGPGAALSIPLGIVKGTIVGGIEGVRDLVQGDADLESFLHVASLAAIPFTVGASAAAAGMKAAHAGITMGNAARAGRVMASFQKLNKWATRQTRSAPGTWGGLNFRKWNEMGPVTKTSMVAENLEYVTNPEELWYEIIGDVGLQGAAKAFQGSSEWVTEQLTNPEKRMTAQEKGLEKKIARVRKMDAGMADTFQQMYDALPNTVGAEVSEGRIAELDNLINTINKWEDQIKFNWVTRQYENEDINEATKAEYIKGAQERYNEIQTQEAESSQTQKERTTFQPPTQTTLEEQTPQPTPTAPTEQEQPPDAGDTVPTQAPETQTPSTQPETDRVREQSEVFEDATVGDLELGDLENVNENALVQNTEEQNLVVRDAIDQKAARVFQQAEAVLSAMDEATEARAFAEENPDNAQAKLDADSAGLAVTTAMENWLNLISAKIGREPEGETATNEDYIADPVARAKKHQELGNAFLDVALMDPKTEESATPEEAQVRLETRQRIANLAKEFLEANVQRPVSEEEVAFEPEDLPVPEVEETPEALPEVEEPEVEAPEPETPEAPVETPETEEAPETPPTPPQPGTITEQVLFAIDAASEHLSASEIVQLTEGLSIGQVRGAIQRLRKQGSLIAMKDGKKTVYGRGSSPITWEIEKPPEAPEPETPEAPAPTPTTTVLDKIFGEIDADTEERGRGDDSGGQRLASIGQKSYAQDIVERLESGVLTPEELDGLIASFEAEGIELSQKRPMTAEESERLDKLRGRLYHLRDARAVWQGRSSPVGLSDIIDGVLYFKIGPSSGPFKSFSNFFPISLRIGDKDYLSLEHYFQAMKFEPVSREDAKLMTTRTDRNGRSQPISVAEHIRLANTPGIAFKLAQTHFQRLSESQKQAWFARRNDVMMRGLLAKFTSPVTYNFGTGESKTLAQWLLDTGDIPLVHLEHVNSARSAVGNEVPYWGAYQTIRGLVGENKLGKMLEQLRSELRQGNVTVREPTQKQGMMSVSDLPKHIRDGLEAIGISAQFLHTFRNIDQILAQINNGEIVVGVGGSRRDKSATTGYYQGLDWVNLSPEEIRSRKVELAQKLDLITEESEFTEDVEAAIDAYNRTQQSGADAAYAVGEALTRRGVVATGGAIGSDISAVSGAVGTRRTKRDGSAIVMMPTGISKTPSPFTGQMEYNPNVPQLDDPRKNIAAVSLYPPEYDANVHLREGGTPTFTANLFERNGVVAAFSHVFFVTHSSREGGRTGGTVDAAEKALQAGRPVVMLDPDLFEYPLEGSRYLATLPGVYVVRHSSRHPIFTEGFSRNKRTGRMEQKRTWDGDRILRIIQAVGNMHYPDADFTANRKESVRVMSEDWSDADFKERIRLVQRESDSTNSDAMKLMYQSEIMLLNRIRAERHPTQNKPTSVDYDYVSPLTEEERQITGSLAGLHAYNSFEEFYDSLKQSGVKVFVDVRQSVHDKQKDASGKLVETWSHGPILAQAFENTDIKYVHASQFTPSMGVRQYQQIVDELTNISKRDRGALGAGFTAAYQNFLKETSADLGIFLKDMIAIHVGQENISGSSICFSCVEHESRACHRSVLGEIMRDALGISVVDIHAGGLTTEYEPHDHSTSGLPTLTYSGKTAVAVTALNAQYIPGTDSLLELIDYTTNADGQMQWVKYRHADYPMWELAISRGEGDTLNFNVFTPETHSAELLKRESEIESELGAPVQMTPFVSQSKVLDLYRQMSLDSENIPVVAEHVLRALAPSIHNPGIQYETEDVESAPDDPLQPAYNGRLQRRQVRIIPRDENLVFSPVTRRVGERLVVGEEHQTRDEDQKVTRVQEGIASGTRRDPTEYETSHYFWRESPDVEVRLSPSGKYLSVVVPQGRNVELPANYPINIQVHQDWESFLKGHRLAESWGRESTRMPMSEVLYEYLSTHRFLWHAVNNEGQRMTGLPADALPPRARNLPEHVYSAVYGNMTAQEAESEWQKVRAFIARSRISRDYGLVQNTAEVDAARRFALRAPSPPSILTQVRRYLSDVHKAMKRLDPVVDTPAQIPFYTEHEPLTLSVGELSEVTNDVVGGASAVDADVETIVEEEQVVASEQPDTVEELENVEPEESEQEQMTDTLEQADQTVTEGAGEDIRKELLDMAVDAGAAGIPFPDQIKEYFGTIPDWLDRYESVATVAENGFDARWQDGSLRLRSDIYRTDPTTGEGVKTGEQRSAGLRRMFNITHRNLSDTAKRASKDGEIQINAMIETLDRFRDENFNQLDMWGEDGVALREVMNVLRSSYNLMVQHGGRAFIQNKFELKGHLLTSLPTGRLQTNERPILTDYILTNTGMLVPANEMHNYVIDPELKQVMRRPEVQLSMLIDNVQSTDPQTGETTTVPRFYVDRNRFGQSFEVLSDTAEEIEVRMGQSGFTAKFVKDDVGRVTLENREAGVQYQPIYIANWKDVPLNTQNPVHQALAPIAMAVRNGFFASTGNVPIELYQIDMADEGSWSFRLKGTVGFDWGAEGLVESDEYQFVVSVVPAPNGFVYRVEAFRGIPGEPDTDQANIFTDNNVPVAYSHALIKKDGQVRTPHEAILASLYHQRETAIAEGWELSRESEVKGLVFPESPNIENWRDPSDVYMIPNPNDVYFQSWETSAQEIEAVFGKEVVRAAERAIFESELPIHSRDQAMLELDSVINTFAQSFTESQDFMETLTRSQELSPTRLRRMIEVALPGLLRAHFDAQNTFSPTDNNFKPIDSGSPVVRSYSHEKFEGYTLDILEGGYIAEIRYKGTTVNTIDYTNSERMWDAVEELFDPIVREHITRRAIGGQYEIHSLARGTIWESQHTNIIFEAESNTVVGEIGGVVQEETRHQLSEPYASKPIYEQYPYVERIGKQLEAIIVKRRSPELEVIPERREPVDLSELMDETGPIPIAAGYTGVVEELPPDVDDFQIYAGRDNPPIRVRRFAIDGSPIQIHLIPPDKIHPKDKRVETVEGTVYWERYRAEGGPEGDVWRRVTFFDTNKGEYIRYDPVASEWKPDIHTFQAEPVTAFGRPETGTIPEYEYPSDPDAADTPDTMLGGPNEVRSERSEGFPDLRRQAQLEEQNYRESQIWMHVQGASDSLIKQKVEDIFSAPVSWKEGETDIEIDTTSATTGMFGRTRQETLNEIQRRSTEFLQSVRDFNKRTQSEGTPLPSQPEIGLTPDGVMVAIPDTFASLESIGFTTEGERIYLTSHAWEIVVSRESPNTFNVLATHDDSGSLITVSNLPEIGTATAQTRIAHFSPDVEGIYRGQGYFANGEESIAVNSFDSAALLGAQFVDAYARSTQGQRAEYNALLNQHPNIEVAIDSFIELFDEPNTFTDNRRDYYRDALGNRADAQEILNQFMALETRRRNLQNGMENGVANYKKQQSSLEKQLRMLGVEGLNLRPIRRTVPHAEISEGRSMTATAPDFEGVTNAIMSLSGNVTQEKALMKMVNSLAEQYQRLTIEYAKAIRDVNLEIHALKVEHFGARPIAETERRNTEDVAFAFLSEYLNRDEMSGLLLGTHPASAAFHYLFDMNDAHPGSNLVLDADAFDEGTGSIDLGAMLSDAEINDLFTRMPDATGVTADHTQEFEQDDGSVIGSYLFHNNPFIRINVVSVNLDDFERTLIVVAPRFSTRQGRDSIRVEIDVEGERIEAQDRMSRMPKLVEQFALANYHILSRWVNPVASNNVTVSSFTETSALNQREYTTYRITDSIESQVLSVGENEWLVGFQNEGRVVGSLPTNAEDIASIQASASGVSTEADIDTVENADLLRLEEVPSGFYPRVFSNYVRATSASEALQKVIMQKLMNPEQNQGFRQAIASLLESSDAFTPVEARVANNLASEIGSVRNILMEVRRQTAEEVERPGTEGMERIIAGGKLVQRAAMSKAISDAASEIVRAITRRESQTQTGMGQPLEQAVISELNMMRIREAYNRFRQSHVSLANTPPVEQTQASFDTKVSQQVAQALFGRQIARSTNDAQGQRSSSFLDRNGNTRHPILTDIMPVGAEDIHHPETREFIAQSWKDFIDTFDTLSKTEERIGFLTDLVGNWQNAYLSRWENASMSGLMLEIQSLAARSGLTAWLKRQEIPSDVGDFYASLVQYSKDINDTEGEVSPHLAFAAQRVANIKETDSVRIEDAGDGLATMFVGNTPREVQYTDANPLRRAIFDQLYPDREIGSKGSGAVDVLITANTGGQSVSSLLANVNAGGRLVIHGDSDWHRISARVISQLKKFDSVEKYVLSLKDKGLDEASMAMHTQLFSQWKSLGKHIRGTLHFRGQMSAYASEGGAVIVVDNLQGNDTKYKLFNLTNAQEHPFSDYVQSFDSVAATRYGSPKETIAHLERVAEKAKKQKEAMNRRKEVINHIANKDKAKIFRNYPDIRMRVLAIGRQANAGNLIPKGTHFETAEELAVIAEISRNPSMATIQVIISESGVARSVYLAGINTGEDVAGSAESIAGMLPGDISQGLDMIVVVNRPSGDTTIGESDEALAKELAKKYPAFRYLLIRNGDTYSTIPINRNPDGTPQSYARRQNMPLNRKPQSNIETISRPSWIPEVDSEAGNEFVSALHSDLERIHSDHIRAITDMTASEDNWAVVAVLNQDGSLASMVEIPNAFTLDRQGVRDSVDWVRETWGGADTFLVLASSEHITNNPDFFNNNPWGQYLEDFTAPGLKGHILVGAGDAHATKRVKENTVIPQARNQDLRLIAKQVAPNISANMSSELAKLFPSNVKGNLWEKVKKIFVKMLNRDLGKTQTFSVIEEIEMRNQVNFSAARQISKAGIVPNVSGHAEVVEMFKSLQKYMQKWQVDTTIPLNGQGLSIPPAHAYMMHYLANATSADFVLIPNAAEGMLASFSSENTLLTEPDVERRGQLYKYIAFGENINSASSTNLSTYWQQNESLRDTRPDVVLLDSRSPETFWQELNEALHTAEVDGRVVAHLNLEMDEQSLATFKEQASLNLPYLKRYYQLRMFANHANRLMVVVDRVDQVDPNIPVIQKEYDNDDAFLADAEKIKMTREGAVIEPEAEQAPETVVGDATRPAPDPAAEAQEQEHHTKPDPINIADNETHRQWILRMSEATGRELAFRHEVQKLYDEMMDAARAVETEERSESDIREDIYTAWHNILGLTPDRGWERFIARLTAGTFSTNYNPDMIYRLKLFEMLDGSHQGRLVNFDNLLDPVTDEIDTLVSTSYRMSHNKPVQMMGETVKDAEDVAILFQPFRNPYTEKMLFVGVNENGEVIKPIGLTAREGYGTEGVNNWEIQRILANNPEVKKFWIVHNHPEMDSLLSIGDMNIHSNVVDRFPDQFMGDVVTDTGEFSASLTDGTEIRRQRITKPIDADFLNRAPRHGIVGTSAGNYNFLSQDLDAASPESIAELVRDSQQELASHPDLITLVFVSPQLDEIGGEPRMQVVGHETHKNLLSMDPESIQNILKERNSEWGAFHTYAVVHNPSDRSLYEPEGSLYNAIHGSFDPRRDPESPLTGIFVDTTDATFPMKSEIVGDINVPVLQGYGMPGVQYRAAGIQLDLETAEPIDPRKQRKFTEFLLLQYLSQNQTINWAEARAYADRYFGESISEEILRGMGDLAFEEHLSVSGLGQKLKNAEDAEIGFMVVDNLYRNLVNPESTPAGVPETAQTGRIVNKAIVENLTYLAMNPMMGETLDYQRGIHSEDSPIRKFPSKDGVIEMNEDPFFDQHNFNINELDGTPRKPTMVVRGIGNWGAKGGLEGNYDDPLFVIKDALVRLAPGGRAIIKIDGGTFKPGEIELNRTTSPPFSDVVSGEDAVPLNTPLLSKLIPAYIREKAGEINVAQRNAEWGLEPHEMEYYAGNLDELFNPNENTVQAFIRLSEYQSHIVIDKVPSAGEGTDVSVNPRPDLRTLVEKYMSLRHNRPRVSSRHLRALETTQHPHVQPEATKTAPHLRSAFMEASRYQADIAARIGSIRSIPRVVVQDTEYGRRRTIDDSSGGRQSSFRQSRYPQMIVTGLEGRVTRDQLMQAFADHGEVINIIIPDNYDGNAAFIDMRDRDAAAAAIQAINGNAQIFGNVVPEVKEVQRDTQRPSEKLPTGDPDSLFAWDVFLNSPFLPEFIRKKWMAVFDIKSISDRAGNRTFLREEDASLPRKTKQRWSRFWEGGGGEDYSRPIDQIKRWGNAGLMVADKMLETLYEARARGGDAKRDIMDVYKTLRANPAIREELEKGSTEQIYASHAGYQPSWVWKVRGIEKWVDEKNEVERVVHNGKVLTHQDAQGRWVTELFLSNAPLLDAWINTFFDTQSFSVFPHNPEVSKLLQTELKKVRDIFNRQDMEWVKENERILATNLLSPVDHSGIGDITDALEKDNINTDALKAYAERFGIQMPDEIEVYELPKKGTMRQWAIVAADNVEEIFRIRQFDSQESLIAKARRDPEAVDELTSSQRERHINSMNLYKNWTNRTLIYEPDPRDPIWSKKDGEPFQLFAGRPHDMPRFINWASMNPYGPKDSKEQQAYLDYLNTFYEVNASLHQNDPNWTYNGRKWSLPYADEILKKNFNGFNDMLFEAIEGDSELAYPSVAYESLPILGEYAMKSAQRTAEMLNYGQDGDIIKQTLEELRNPDNLDLDDTAKAVLKLRKALGHDDFGENNEDFIVEGNVVVPFHLAAGVRRTTRPGFDKMTASDWQALIDANIVTLVETNQGREGFYAWGDPGEAVGENVRTQPWIGGGTVSFELASHAGALVNMAILNMDEPIFKEVAEANYRYAAARDALERLHLWNPKILEMTDIQKKMDAIYADPLMTQSLRKKRTDTNAEFVALIKEKRKRMNSVTAKGLRAAQNLAVGLLMRLSAASQIGTAHNPTHRTGFMNYAKGVVDELANEKERERVERVGSYILEVNDIISMGAENVSQENLGFNQKLLGMSNYFHWNIREHGGMKNFLHALYNRGNWTPFALMERRLRGTAAVGGKHLTKDTLTELLIPGKIALEGQALAARRQQHITALEELDVTVGRQLRNVLELRDPTTNEKVAWTENLINQLTEMSFKEAQEVFHAQPHLAAVSKLTDRVMQVMPDYAHYAGTRMHIPRVLQDHLFLRVIFLFQTMMLEQTRNMAKMIRYNFKQIATPARMAKESGKELSFTDAAKLTAPEVVRKLPHFLLSAGAILGAGFLATVLADLVRGRLPDDDDMTVFTWITNAAVFGAATGYVESVGHYKGLERQVAGPLVGLAGDFIRDPLGTAWFYGARPWPVDFRPLIGFWLPNETPHDLERSVAAGGFRQPTGTSLAGVRAP